jgi:vacuolar-type H+-ATPase subunit D/Vma8
MNVRNLTALAAFLVFGSVACDPSKPELDKTKAELATITAERDGLKSQLEQANAKVTQLTTQNAELTAKIAAAAAPAAEPAAEAKPAAKKAAGKPKVKPLTTEEKKDIQAAPKTRTGAGAF